MHKTYADAAGVAGRRNERAVSRGRAVCAGLAGLALLAACTVTTGSGNVVSEQRPVNGFTTVDLVGDGEVTIDQSGTESLTVEAEDNVLPKLKTEVANGTLRLGDHRTPIIHTKPITYHLSMKDLSGLRITGSGNVTAAKITTARLTVEITGSGALTIGGTADDQQVTISGSGSYQAADLSSKTATADISGSGDATVQVADRLDVRISGSGNLTYHGSPQVTQKVTGSGTVVQS